MLQIHTLNGLFLIKTIDIIEISLLKLISSKLERV